MQESAFVASVQKRIKHMMLEYNQPVDWNKIIFVLRHLLCSQQSRQRLSGTQRGLRRRLAACFKKLRLWIKLPCTSLHGGERDMQLSKEASYVARTLFQGNYLRVSHTGWFHTPLAQKPRQRRTSRSFWNPSTCKRCSVQDFHTWRPLS